MMCQEETRIEEIIFLGAGSSCCVPCLPCFLHSNTTKEMCAVCSDARDNPHSRNRRLNTCCVLRIRTGEGSLKTILIDCGKTFYQSAVQWWHHHGLSQVDAVILTHGHADAILGLDELRSFTGKCGVQSHIDIYCDQSTMSAVAECFPYLIDTSKATGGGFVSDLRFHSTIQPGKAFELHGLNIMPFSVEHGTRNGDQPYHCLGFYFGNTLCYLSDISRMPEECYELIGPVEVLIVDCLRVAPPYKSHYCMDDSLALSQRLQAKRTYFVGMTHAMDYRVMQPLLDAEHKGRVQMAYDGLKLSI